MTLRLRYEQVCLELNHAFSDGAYWERDKLLNQKRELEKRILARMIEQRDAEIIALAMAKWRRQ